MNSIFCSFYTTVFLALSLRVPPLALAFVVVTVAPKTFLCVSNIQIGATSTRLQSIPNLIDTVTSGLASICRLPKGVTAVSTASSTDDNTSPQISRLWDIENNKDCRAVREVLTELDVIVPRVIPAAENARSIVDPCGDPSFPHFGIGSEEPVATAVPILELQDGTILSGKTEIMTYLEGCKRAQATTAMPVDQDTTTIDELKGQALQLWDSVSNTLASTLRVGRGSRVAACAQYGRGTTEPPRPQLPLILYSYEGNQFCRLVREVLTELDIVYEVRSAGKESPRPDELRSITGGSSQCPFLIDPNTNIDMAESKDIIEYLYKTYAKWTPPNEVLEWTSAIVMPLLKPLFQFLTPLQAGSFKDVSSKSDYGQSLAAVRQQIDDDIQSNAVVVYTYELSPFCTEAKDLLTRLGVDYKEISLGKEWIPGLITPEGAKTRAALLEMTGQSSLPHVFIGAKSIGGLFSGSPGLIPALEKDRRDVMVESATEVLTKRNSIG